MPYNGPMTLNPETLRYILGLKLRRFRREKGYGLKEVAAWANMSVSYLSEIEKGKKYPKPEKLVPLARALEVPYEELVSPRFEGDLRPLRMIFESSFIQEFPFHLYGIELEGLLDLITEAPREAQALVSTALDIGQLYDVEVEHFLRSALRSYQVLHRNYFPRIEEAAERFRGRHGWAAGEAPTAEALAEILADEHGIVVDDEALGTRDELSDLRAVWVAGSKPQRLLVNGRLLPSQRAFMVAREFAYRELDLGPRSVSSPPLETTSFDQVIHDFEAAYFSGAVLLDRQALGRDLETFFAEPRWSSDAFLELLGRYQATPETFFYRLSQLLPGLFGLRELYFVRFHHPHGSTSYHLTKILNMTQLPIPFGSNAHEHYCRRWPGMGEAETGTRKDAVRVTAQRSRFLSKDGGEFLLVTLSRPLALTADTHSSISLGLRIDDALKERLAFLDDPEIPRVDVHLTCERCPLAPEECAERVAPPAIVERERRQARRLEALRELMEP